MLLFLISKKLQKSKSYYRCRYDWGLFSSFAIQNIKKSQKNFRLKKNEGKIVNPPFSAEMIPRSFFFFFSDRFLEVNILKH
jgi:hypothetical protein